MIHTSYQGAIFKKFHPKVVIAITPCSAQVKAIFKNIVFFQMLGCRNDHGAGAGVEEEGNGFLSGAQGELGH